MLRVSVSTIPRRRRRSAATPGTTLGEQRLIAFQYAASSGAGPWTAPCRSGSARSSRRSAPTFSAAPGRSDACRDFPNAPRPGRGITSRSRTSWRDRFVDGRGYGGARNPSGPQRRHRRQLQHRLHFYLGLDNNHGAKNDLVAVLLHEFAHGLGFSQQASLTTGALPRRLTGTYNPSCSTTDGTGTAADDQRRARGFGDPVRAGSCSTAPVVDRRHFRACCPSAVPV